MAVFSNGTEGMDYEERYCSRCANHRLHPNDPYGGDYADCPVWALHFEYNHERGGKTKLGKAIKDILDTLIPMQKDGLYADECSMFLEREPNQEEYLKRLREGQAPVQAMLEMQQ